MNRKKRGWPKCIEHKAVEPYNAGRQRQDGVGGDLDVDKMDVVRLTTWT